jgi:rhodanese-related sulfurtransferase
MSAASINAQTLYEELGLPDSHYIVDVRGDKEIEALPKLIPGSVRGAADVMSSWAHSLPKSRPIAVYCSHGRDASRNAAEALANLGFAASYLHGGLESWCEARHVTTRARREFSVPGGSRWVTRERPKIDRLACPWLVKRFIDPDATFFYTPAQRVRSDAETLQAQPYDIADVTFSHRGSRCSFDAFLEEFDLHDPVMDRLATIVRAADTGELAQSREAPGLLAISLGLSQNYTDDLLLLDHALPLYDALYAWCKKVHDETHSWPQKRIAQ